MAGRALRVQLKKWYNAAEVMTPLFKVVAGVTDDRLMYRDLLMQTFVQDAKDPTRWASTPEIEWHHLARILLDQITTYPVFTNPHAMRYLAPRHGRFRKVVYDNCPVTSLPDDATSAISVIEQALPWGTSNPCSHGLGFVKSLDEVWRGLMRIPALDTILVSNVGGMRVDGSSVCFAEGELSQIRRDFDRAGRKMREVLRQARTIHVRNALLARLDPDKFPAIVQVEPCGQLVEFRLNRRRTAKAADAAGRRATVKAVVSNVEVLAAEAPGELIQLHAEIERATLAQMIRKFEDMLQKNLPEKSWQKFFERNIFILTMVFARPVRLLHSQFHAQGSSLDGKGAQVGDFLLAEQGFALAIVEIKRPASPLLRPSPYRNREVFAPDEELSGAVSQVLYQQSKIQEHWLVHQSRAELRNSRPDAIKCVVITGMLPADEMQRRSLEVFRNASRNVEVITFDELLGKLQILSDHLAPQAVPSSAEVGNDVPF